VSNRIEARRPTARRLDLAAGFLGAITAIGMTVVLFLGAVAIMFLVARVRHAGAAAVAAEVLSHTATTDVVGALLLSLMVLGAFFCGGYVAARLTRFAGRRQAVVVWLWAVPVPTALTLVALACSGVAHPVVAAVRSDSTIGVLGLGLAALGLLGALLGGDTGQRADAPASVPAPIPHALR